MPDSDSRIKRWRLILGGDDADGTGITLDATALAIDQFGFMRFPEAGSSGRAK